MVCLSSRIMRFINNEPCKDKILFNIIENISWHNKKDINDYLVKTIKDNQLYSSYYLYHNDDNNFSGSTQAFLSMLASEGVIEQNQIIELDKVQEQVRECCEKIVIVDDYIGSGEKVISFIDVIEKYLTNWEVVILCYVCQKEAANKIIDYTRHLNNKYELFFLEEAIKYDEIIQDDRILSYIASVCNCCSQPTYSFGKNGTGALLAINGISPNNNISLIWHNSIIYKSRRWVPLLHRNLTIETLGMKNKGIIKKGKIIWVAEYKKSVYSKKIDQDNFELLLLIFNCFATIEEIIKFGYYDTIDQVNENLRNLVDSKFIVIKNGYIMIIDYPLIKELDRITNRLYKDVTKKKVNNQIVSDRKEMTEKELEIAYGIKA